MSEKTPLLERWYDRVKQLAASPKAEPALAVVAFAESSFFPIPPDIMLIPMVQANHNKAWRYAFICTLASVLGGIAGYFIGYMFYDSVALPLIERMGKLDKVKEFQHMVQDYGAVAVFGAGLTPFPYKVITIMSGALKLNFGIFIAASALSRGLRYFLIAGIVKKFGDQAEAIIRKNFTAASIIIFMVVVALWALFHFVLAS